MNLLEEATKRDGTTEVGVAMDEAGTTTPHPMAKEGGTDMMHGTNTGGETDALMIAMGMTSGNMIGTKTMVQDGVGGAIHPLGVGGAIHLLVVDGAIHPLEVGGAILPLEVAGDMNLIEVGGTTLRGMAIVERRERGLEVRGYKTQ